MWYIQAVPETEVRVGTGVWGVGCGWGHITYKWVHIAYGSRNVSKAITEL